MSSVRSTPEKTKVVICALNPFSEWNAKPIVGESLSRRWPEVRVAQLNNYDRVPQEIVDADVFVGSRLRPEHFVLAQKLQWVHSTAAGVAQLMYPQLRESRIILTNASGVFSIPMAEHIIGVILALARNIPDSVRQQDQKIWSQQNLWDTPQQLTEVNGTLLLIVGYGSIGREIAKRASPLEMRVWGVTRSGNGALGHAEKIVSVRDLDDVLPQADFVVLAAPDTPDTKQLMNASRIARMKRGARLINVGRGALLDEAALVSALRSHALGGAALDVAEKEPLPQDSPLWSAPNILITPHTSAASDRLWNRETALLLRLFEKYFSGDQMPNRVDLARGY